MSDEAREAELSTEGVREAFAAQRASLYVDDWADQRAKFDRWLAARDAEMRAEGIRQAREAVAAQQDGPRFHRATALAAIDALGEDDRG